MADLTWLHISDLHRRIGASLDSEIVRAAFFRDLTTAVHKGRAIDLIFFTGDLTFSGMKAEYQLASQFLDAVLKTCRLRKKRLFLIPGNHDVDRSKISPVAKTSSTNLLSREDVNTVLEDKGDLRLLCARLSGYSAFLRNYYGTLLTPSLAFPPYTLATSLKIRGCKVGILGLNSTWLSAGDTDERSLLIGDSQIRQALTLIGDTDLNIALVHHPLEWLKAFDADESEALLTSSCSFLLRGHLHKSKIRELSNPDGRLIQIAAGSLYAGPTWPNGYNIVHFDTATQHGRIILRRFSPEGKGFFAADTLTYENSTDGVLEFRLAPTVKSNISHSTTRRGLRFVSESLLRETGRKRTAYPTDMSFEELRAHNVYLAPSFHESDTATAARLSLHKVCSTLRRNRSLLLLGSPGSGKSFASYLIHHQLNSHSRDSTVWLPANLHVLLSAAVDKQIKPNVRSFLALLARSHGAKEYAAILGDRGPEPAIGLIVDGIDEVAGDPTVVKRIAASLQKLRTVCSLLVTCRRRDYDYVYAPYMSGLLFDQVLSMNDWRFPRDFAKFLSKLGAAGLAGDPKLLDLISREEGLRELARRPLHARMLTFVGADGMLPKGITQLYGVYLQKYAAATDAGFIAGGVLEEPKCYRLWRSIAWHIFQNGLLVHDKVPWLTLIVFVRTRENVKAHYANRILQPLFNFVRVFDEEHLQFVHYSFYEFYVADYIGHGLIDCYRTENKQVGALFRRDLPREIRHHLIERLSLDTCNGLSAWLGHVYSNELRADIYKPNELRVIRNLLSYLLGRLPEKNDEVLWGLLRAETDLFLRNALYWALCGRGSLQGLKECTQMLTTDREFGELNRGYLLYYYGDIDHTDPPPYRDSDVRQPWSRTRLLSLQMMVNRGYGNVQPTRRALDVITFLSFSQFRKEALRSDETETLRSVIAALSPELRDEGTVTALIGALEQCNSR